MASNSRKAVQPLSRERNVKIIPDLSYVNFEGVKSRPKRDASNETANDHEDRPTERVIS